MKKQLLFILFIVFGCSSTEDNLVIMPTTQINNLKIVVQPKEPGSSAISKKEYVFDLNGKVIKETFTNYLYPQHNFISTFEYDTQNHLVKEFKNGQLFYKIVWTGNFAELFTENDLKIADFTYLNNKLTEMNWGFFQGMLQNTKYNYDTNSNVISVEKDNQVYVEYLNYQQNIQNPLNLLKSIEIVRFSSQYNFKNVFNIERLYGYNGSDYIFQTTDYEYFRTLDANQRIISETDMKTLIYRTTYEYN